jgi:hypothetical protein
MNDHNQKDYHDETLASTKKSLFNEQFNYDRDELLV